MDDDHGSTVSESIGIKVDLGLILLLLVVWEIMRKSLAKFFLVHCGFGHSFSYFSCCKVPI